MDTDAAPRPRTVPIWLRITAWSVAVYLVLWAATFVVAARNLRAQRESFQKVFQKEVRFLSGFDPAVPPETPSDEGYYNIFLGNLSCPCPLVVSYDYVLATRSATYAAGSTELNLLGRTFPLRHRIYWK